MSFGPLTVTVVRRGWDGSTRDRQNNPVVSELGTFDLEGCLLQQVAASEDLDARETATTQWVLFAPPPPQAVGHIDQVRIDATAAKTTADPGQSYATFEQVGHPDHAGHIDGTTHHLELTLQRIQL